MGYSTIPRPVFVHTNLGTRLALPLSPDITANDFKRVVEGMHLDCFPEYGSIRVSALMVKQKSCYYHLSESLPLKYAFLGPDDTWFLQISMHQRSIPEPLKCNDVELHNPNCIANGVTDSTKLGEFALDKRTKSKRKKQRSPYFKALKISAFFYFLRRKKKRKRKNAKKKSKSGCSERGLTQPPLNERETPRQLAEEKSGDKNAFSEAAASVSGIINRYFSDYDEVDSGLKTIVQSRRREWLNGSSECQYPNIQSPQTQVSPDVWLDRPRSEAPREKCSKPEVGKRLLLASDSLGLSPRDKHSVLSLHKYSNGRSPLNKSIGPIKNLVFEITEESD